MHRIIGKSNTASCRLGSAAAIWLRGWCCALCFFAFSSLATHGILWAQQTADSDQPLKARLRFSWGGPEAVVWQGSIQVSNGRLLSVTPLGLEPDEPGSFISDDQQILINSASTRRYDALDIVIAGNDETIFEIEMRRADRPLTENAAVALRKTTTLEEIIAQPTTDELVGSENRMHVSVAPGSLLRFDFQRPTLVFTTGEMFQTRIVALPKTYTPRATINYQLSLLHARTRQIVWSDNLTAKVDEQGRPVAASVEIPMPATEGVYDLEAAIEKKSIKLFENSEELRRKIQLVVLSPNPLTREAFDERSWQALFEFDPNDKTILSRMRNLPRGRFLPALAKGQKPWKLASNPKSAQVEFEPNQSQTISLPTKRFGQPHILEIEYPTGWAQTLGVNLFASDFPEKGELTRSSGGMIVPAPIAASHAGIELEDARIFRMLFWPTSSSTLLVLTNRSPTKTARFLKIRLLGGPQALPPAEIPVTRGKPNETGRVIACYYDQPLFTDQFGTIKPFEAWANQNIHDWNTFYEGAIRFAAYLKHAGYNAAILNVAGQGSALYPSNLLQPTPHYDNGCFFLSGQDPIRKDVLEMLFRIFDREGLLLIPSLDFAGPLPQLESLRRDAGSAVGIDAIQINRTSALESAGSAPRYNVLDTRVQAAMNKVVEEIASRYAHHPSYRGISLKCAPDSYIKLAGEFWGYDADTLNRFAAEHQLELPEDAAQQFEQMRGLVIGRLRQDWLNWRAAQVSNFYQQLTQIASAGNSRNRLYVTPVNMFDTPELQSVLRPSLTTLTHFNDAMLRLGFDAARLASIPSLVFPRPSTDLPIQTLAQRRTEISLEELEDCQQFFGRFVQPADVFIQPQSNHFIEEQSLIDLLDPRAQQIRVAEQYILAESWQRRRFIHRLANGDSQVMINGGTQLNLGNEEALASLASVFQQLPPTKFETVSPAHGEQAFRHTLIRSAIHDGRWYAYIVNDSPWPAQVQISFSKVPETAITNLNDRQLIAVQRVGASGIMQVSLQPYDLVGLVADDKHVTIDDYQFHFPENVSEVLQKSISQLQAIIRFFPDSPAISGLDNPSFEQPLNSQPGEWSWGNKGNAKVKIEATTSQAFDGNSSLHIDSGGPVAWVRSPVLQSPATGRLSMLVWMRTAKNDQQPALRLSVEGVHRGEDYYRFGEFGKTASVNPRDPSALLAENRRLHENWRPYAVHFDDLPTSDLSELRVGFDLFGAGEVWIDKVEVLDRWFDENDRQSLTQFVARAGHQLRVEKNLAGCQRTLEGYWPRFLSEYLSAPTELNNGPVSRTAAVEPLFEQDTANPDQEDPESENMLDRMRNLVPKRILPFK